MAPPQVRRADAYRLRLYRLTVDLVGVLSRECNVEFGNGLVTKQATLLTIKPSTARGVMGVDSAIGGSNFIHTQAMVCFRNQRFYEARMVEIVFRNAC